MFGLALPFKFPLAFPCISKFTHYLVRKIYGGARPKRVGSARDGDRLPFRARIRVTRDVTVIERKRGRIRRKKQPLV
jgi:hypothetical protein